MLGSFLEVDDYFAQTDRHQSKDDIVAREAIIGCLQVLGHIAVSMQELVKSRSDLSIRFTLADETNGKYPAFSGPDREEGHYVIGITVPMLHLLYLETEKITREHMSGRRYSRDAYFVLAAVFVICHEFAHIALGHFDGNRPPRSIVRADEFSADDHGGRITSRQFALELPALKHYCGIETLHDFVEAALIGQASLFSVLQFLHQPSAIYHSPALRVRHMYGGFIKGILLKKLLSRKQMAERCKVAMSLLDGMGGDFTHPNELAAVLTVRPHDVALFNRETAIDASHRVAETMNQSRFLAPLRDQIGGFQAPTRKKRWRAEDHARGRGKDKQVGGMSRLRALLHRYFGRNRSTR